MYYYFSSLFIYPFPKFYMIVFDIINFQIIFCLFCVSSLPYNLSLYCCFHFCQYVFHITIYSWSIIFNCFKI